MYSKDNTLRTFSNTIKKNNFVELLLVFYSFFFCIGISVLCGLNLIFNSNFNNKIMILNSIIYFIIDGFYIYYKKDKIFILHHILSLLVIFFILLNNTAKLYKLLNVFYLSEISTIFLNLFTIFKKLKFDYNFKISNNYSKYSILAFSISFLLFRICLIIPYGILFLKNNFHEIKFKYIILILLMIMGVIYTHWAFVIINKLLVKKEKKSIINSNDTTIKN